MKKKLTLQLFLGARLNLNILTSAAVEVHFMLSTRQYAIKCTTHDPHTHTIDSNRPCEHCFGSLCVLLLARVPLFKRKFNMCVCFVWYFFFVVLSQFRFARRRYDEILFCCFHNKLNGPSGL